MKSKPKTSFTDLVKIMARLRAPGGCPWDREQTHTSLLKYLKEESAEVIQAVERNDMENLEEELGDVLLQILFHAQMASERGDFDINGVLETLKHKLVHRHPHVFARGKKETLTAEEVKRRWKDLKTKEKNLRSSSLRKQGSRS
jgi:tetrapyrrole methylase family protein / MazG family protein